MTDGTPPPPPPNQPPPHQPPPPSGGGASSPPPATTKSSGCLKWFIAAVVLVLLAGVGVVACVAVVGENVTDEIERQIGEADPGDYDLSLDDCSVSLGIARASGTITNTSGEEQGFEIDVRFETDDGTLLGESTTFTDAIRIDQRAQWSTSPSETVADGTGITCEVVEVSYTIFD